jgi:hypothetical protein
MNDANPSNRKIEKAMNMVFPELVGRYGGYINCSLNQVSITCSDLKIENEIIPYIFAGCLAPELLTTIQSEMSHVNWEEVKNRMSRLVKEYRLDNISSRAHFYESGIGMIPVD